MHFATSIEIFTFTSILNMAIALFSAGGRQQLSWQIYIHALRGASRCSCSCVGTLPGLTPETRLSLGGSSWRHPPLLPHPHHERLLTAHQS